MIGNTTLLTQDEAEALRAKIPTMTDRELIALFWGKICSYALNVGVTLDVEAEMRKRGIHY